MTKRIAYRILSVSIAFIIFGAMDNGVMVLAGTTIDSYIASFGFSTMLSAGLGNTLSDAIGMMSGRYVESLVYSLCPQDKTTKLSPNATIAAETVGVVIGCLLGLIPLIFM